jgi:hypothetical protein
MDDPHSEELLEGVEVVVPVQELVIRLQTKSSDQAIDGFAYGAPRSRRPR